MLEPPQILAANRNWSIQGNDCNSGRRQSSMEMGVFLAPGWPGVSWLLRTTSRAVEVTRIFGQTDFVMMLLKIEMSLCAPLARGLPFPPFATTSMAGWRQPMILLPEIVTSEEDPASNQ